MKGKRPSPMDEAFREIDRNFIYVICFLLFLLLLA